MLNPHGANNIIMNIMDEANKLLDYEAKTTIKEGLRKQIETQLWNYIKHKIKLKKFIEKIFNQKVANICSA